MHEKQIHVIKSEQTDLHAGAVRVLAHDPLTELTLAMSTTFANQYRRLASPS